MDINLQVPDLNGLSNISSYYVMHRFFRGVGPATYAEYALVVNFIRLVDLSILEYQSGRKLLFEFWNTHEGTAVGAINLSSGYFEACISNTKRSLNYLKSIRSYESSPKEIKNLLPRSLHVLKSVTEKKITKLRHAIQHLEKQIQLGFITEGQAVYLKPGQNCLELGGASILYTELASWLTELHECSSKLFEYFSEKKVNEKVT